MDFFFVSGFITGVCLTAQILGIAVMYLVIRRPSESVTTTDLAAIDAGTSTPMFI